MVYSFFAYRHLRRVGKNELRKETLRLSVVGFVGSIVIDFVSFVSIPHPYAFTPQEFYIGYQPWISIIYAVIFISPLLIMFKLNRKEKL